MTNRRRAGVWLAVFVSLAIVARVGVIAYTGALHAPAEENRLIARHLQGGRGFTFTEFTVTGPTAIRGPAYPFLLALIGPDRLWLSLAINTLAGASTVLAAYALTKRLLGPSPLEGEGARRAALIAAFAFAVWPTQIYAASLTQGLAIAVLLLLSSLALAWRKTPGASIAAGVLAGLAALTEPVLALPLLLSAIVLGWRKNWPNAAVFVAVGCVTVAPWLYRNAIVFGRPMPITSNFWRDAFLGNGPNAVGFGSKGQNEAESKAAEDVSTRIMRLPPDQYDRLKTGEAKRVEVFKSWTWPWMQNHPWRYLNLCFTRMSDTLGQAKAWGFGRSPTEHFVFVLSRGLAAAIPLLIWFLMLPYFKVASPLFVLSLCLMVGLSLSTAFSLAVPRNGILMDVPQFLATAALVDRLRYRRQPKPL